MADVSTRAVPRWRMIVFWVLAVAVVFLIAGDPERSHLITGIFTVWGGYAGELATHEIHVVAQSALVWTMIAAFLVNVRGATRQIGSAWQFGLIAVVWMLAYLAFGDMPAEVLPILIGVLVISVLAFVAHPSSMGERLRSVAGPSRLLGGLVLVAAVPLVIYGTNSIRTHLASGSADPHYEFGHWIAMGVFAFVVVAIAAVAASRVSGWRLNAWSAGLLVAILGFASLVHTAASQLDTVWAVLALVWGAAFIVVAELEAREAFGPARSETTPLVDVR